MMKRRKKIILRNEEEEKGKKEILSCLSYDMWKDITYVMKS